MVYLIVVGMVGLLLIYLAHRRSQKKKASHVKTPWEVGVANVEVLDVNEKTYTFCIYGIAEYEEWDDGRVTTWSAKSLFERWVSNIGKSGMVSVGGGKHIPLCSIKEINVMYDKWTVEA